MSFQMDLDVKGFGRGPRELGGATDLVKQYRLWPYHEFFCKRSLPLSETHYLQNVVGDTQIRKGEGMEFDQLLEKTAYMRERNANIHPIDFGMLSEAFRIKETTPVHLPSAEKGILTSVVKSKGELEDRERKHKKNKNKDKDRKKHKKRRLDNSGDVDKTYENVTNGSKTVQLKEQPDMFIQKRRLNGPEDLSDRDNKRLPKSFHFSGNGGGVLHGTCEAIVCTMAAARDQMLSRIGSDNLGKLVVYGSDQTHSTLQKATQIVGIKPENFRVIKTTKSVEFALSPEMLRLTVCSDLDKGLVPLFLCATIGTTSTTAIDQLEALCDVAKEYGIWVHVDGAYVGSAFRHSIYGVEGANSFSFNPHKWLFTAMDCCCLWVKNPSALIRSLSTNPEYLRNKASDSKQVVDYKDWQIALSRRFRALKMWLVLRSYGVANLRSFIRSHVKMAKIFEGLVRMDNRFEIVVPRNFSLVCFRISPSAIVSDDHSYNGEEYNMVNEINCKLLEAINALGSVFMTHAVVGGVYLLRCTVGATLTEEKHIVEAWKVVQGQAHAILSACVVDLHNPMRYPNI